MLYGMLAALIAAICWGSYMVPMKSRPQVDPLRYQWLVSQGIALSCLVLWAVRGFPAVPWLWGMLSGLVWSAGASLSFLAVREEGLSRASVRWMGTCIAASFGLGVVLFGERLNPALALPGILGLLLGLGLLPKQDATTTTAATAGATAGATAPPFLGGWKSLLAGLVFGTYLLPLSWSGAAPMEFAVPMGLGILMGGALVLWIFRPAHSQGAQAAGLTLVGMLSGVVWNIANIASFFAVQILGFAVGFPLTQMALVVSVSLGVGLFGEYPDPAARRRLGFAAFCLLLGAALLGLSK